MLTPVSTTRVATNILRVLTVALGLALVPVPAVAQGADSNADAQIHLGPLDLRPVLSWRTTHEDNVFRSSEHRVSDLVSTLGATTDVRGQLRRVGLSASGAADWVHFSNLISERGANLGAALRLDFLFNRVVPYVSSSYRNSRQRVNPEIDIRPRIKQSVVAAGGVFHVGDKTAVDISAGRAIEGYARDATVDGVNLGTALNRASDHVTLSFLQEVTPLTRLTVAGEMQRDRFNVSQRRSADSILLTTGFESSGRINGSARAGVRILTPNDRSLPKFRAFFVSLGTSVTVLDRVRIGLDAERDLAPSYRQSVAYYESFNYRASLTYAMGASLRLSAEVGQRFADYRASAGAVTLAADQGGVDKETRYGSGISCQVGESVGIVFSGTYTERTSISVLRRFDGLSLSAGVNYAF